MAAGTSSTSRKPNRAKAPAKRTGKVAGASRPKTKADRAPSSRDAVEQVLREADGPMKIREIADQVLERNLAPGLKGKTPAATIGAQVITDVQRKGRFVKVAPGTFDLRELNPRGAKKRPAATAQG